MKRLVLFATAIGLALLVSGCDRFGCGPGEGWGPGDGWGHMMPFGGGGMFMGIIFLVVLTVAVVWWFSNRAGSKDRSPHAGESPLDILKRRYAAGEITKEQFDAMKKDLEA